MIRRYDRLARLNHALTYQSASMIAKALKLAIERLKILLSQETSALHLDKLKQFQIVQPDAPLRHAQDGMTGQM
jgi:hypothetical protein